MEEQENGLKARIATIRRDLWKMGLESDFDKQTVIAQALYYLLMVELHAVELEE